MTKEEAAIIVHKLKQDALTGAVRRYVPFEGEVLLSAEFYDAINMAIEALEQEPTKEEKALLQKWRDNRGISIEEFEDAMNALQEPKTGHWIPAKVGKLFPSNDFRCSECGNVLDFNGVNCGRGDANYCPNCGAKMKNDNIRE